MLARVGLAAHCQPRAVARVLKGWLGQPAKRARITEALAAAGVNVFTIPDLSSDELEEMRQKARPCPACAAKDGELAALRVQFCACEAHMAELLDAERAEVSTLRARVAELEAEKRAPRRNFPQAGEPVLCAARGPVAAQEPPAEPAPPPVDVTPGIGRAVGALLSADAAKLRPAPRPREKCHVSLELDGVDLLGEATG